MANELQNNVITVNGVSITKMVSNYQAKNVLTYVTEPSRTLDFTLENQSIEASYVPTVELTFNYISPSDYALLIQLVNSKGFFAEYYDYEISAWVKRRMYMTDSSLERLRNTGRNFSNTTGDGVVGVKVTFVSTFGYAYCPTTDARWTANNRYHYANVYINRVETRVN